MCVWKTEDGRDFTKFLIHVMWSKPRSPLSIERLRDTEEIHVSPAYGASAESRTDHQATRESGLLIMNRPRRAFVWFGADEFRLSKVTKPHARTTRTTKT